MNNIDEKIMKIDKLLSDDKKFNKYIENIEKQNILDNESLKNRILSKVKGEAPKKKIGYINILKIAACTIFAIFVCELAVIKDDTFRKEGAVTGTGENKLSIMYTNMKTKLNDINGIMLNPVIFERRDNK